MTYKTHLIGGAQAGLLTSMVVEGSYTESVLIVSAAMLGSVLPDLDQPKSKLCQSDVLVGLLSLAISRITKHRGFTHTLPGAALLGVPFYVLAVFQGGRSDTEGLFALLSAFVIFVLLHATGSIFRPLAGCIAVAVYVAGPELADAIIDAGLDLAGDSRLAMTMTVSVIAGAISHIFYDAFNKGGVPILWPVTKRNFRLMEIRTNTAGEFWFIVLQIILLGLMLEILGIKLFFG